MQMQLVYLGAAIGGGALAAAAIWAAWRFTKASAKPRAEPEPVALEILADEKPASFVRAPPAAPPARAAAPPPPASPRVHAERAPAMVLTQGVRMSDAEFSRRAPPPSPVAQAPPMRPPPPKTWAQQARESAGPEVPTEWARRQVGPVEPGRVAGACGGCGTRLSATNARPLRIACPVCGRAKLVA